MYSHEFRLSTVSLQSIKYQQEEEMTPENNKADFAVAKSALFKISRSAIGSSHVTH
jgi:hypothetical protein